MYPQPQHYGSGLVAASAIHSPAIAPCNPNNNSALPFSNSAMATTSPSMASMLNVHYATPLADVPKQTNIHNNKRSISADDESTDEDLDKSLPMADNMDNSCHLMSRKKRRGMIEKRRRDRINNSLHELKRLVPAAFEKQGSAKLEKAEILQMTVDHLRMLHSKGFDAFSFDPHKFATDYHIIGFRECAAEVARYLVVHEGLDFQDPLRLRLISHLQCYSAQRELSLKSSTGWNPSLFTTPMYPPPSMPSNSTSTSAASTSAPSTSSSTLHSSTSSSTSTLVNNNNTCDTMSLQNQANQSGSGSQHNSYSYGSHYQHPQQYDKLDNSTLNAGSNASMSCNTVQANNIKSSMSPAFPIGSYSSGSTAVNTSSIQTSPSSTNSYSYSYPTGTYFAPTAATYSPLTPVIPGNQTGQTNAQTVNSVKHYRPWGTELAY